MTLPLTIANPELAALIRATPPGMAHWAGTGPAGAACKDCALFMGKARVVGVGKGDIRPGRCRKFIALMKAALCRQRAPVHFIPPSTPACSHFAPKVVK